MDLYRTLHEATPLLPLPTPASFPLDFAQLWQATNINPTSCTHVYHVSIPAPMTCGFSDCTDATSSSRKKILIPRTLHGQKIDKEVEDNWDLVDEDIGLD